MSSVSNSAYQNFADRMKHFNSSLQRSDDGDQPSEFGIPDKAIDSSIKIKCWLYAFDAFWQSL